MDQTLSDLKAMYVMDCFIAVQRSFFLETDIFNASLETKCDLLQYTISIYRGSKHIIWFSPSLYPITGGFGKDSAGQHSLITDLLHV